MITSYTHDEPLTARERYQMELAYLPHLTGAQERELIARAQTGDQGARMRLVESCLAWVLAVARKYAWRAGLDVLDVAQQGNMRMLERLDAALATDHPCAFLRVAARGAVINYCMEYTSIIRTPRSGGRPLWVKSLDEPLYEDDEVTLADLIEA